MKNKPWAASAALLAGALLVALAQGAPVPVTVGTFARAETDLYMRTSRFGALEHQREMTDVDHQNVVRMNRDTLYSSGVFDLDAGPVTVRLPDPGKRFMSLQATSEDHYAVDVAYAPGRYTYTRDGVGTRYLFLAVRTLADPGDPADMQAAHALQDAIRLEQPARGRFEVPDWDKGSQDRIRELLKGLGPLRGDDAGVMFGKRSDVDPVAHLIGTAIGWGGNPPAAAMYASTTPAANDGRVVHRLVVKDVPVDGFWSISVYDADGYFHRNTLGAYSLNSITAKRSADGSVPVQFGGCDGRIPNCLPVTQGWNYTVRLYRPRAEVLSGKWKFPEARAVP